MFYTHTLYNIVLCMSRRGEEEAQQKDQLPVSGAWPSWGMISVVEVNHCIIEIVAQYI